MKASPSQLMKDRGHDKVGIAGHLAVMTKGGAIPAHMQLQPLLRCRFAGTTDVVQINRQGQQHNEAVLLPLPISTDLRAARS